MLIHRITLNYTEKQKINVNLATLYIFTIPYHAISDWSNYISYNFDSLFNKLINYNKIMQFIYSTSSLLSVSCLWQHWPYPSSTSFWLARQFRTSHTKTYFRGLFHLLSCLLLNKKGFVHKE